MILISIFHYTFLHAGNTRVSYGPLISTLLRTLTSFFCLANVKSTS